MLSMYAKCLAKCRRGTHFASILPRRPSFSVRIPQIMHSGQILPLFFDLSFVRELCDSCLRGSSGRDQHRGSTFTGILVCPLREGANAAARPLCGSVSVAVRPLRAAANVVVHPPLGRWRRGSSSTWRCKRCGSPPTWRKRCGSSSVGALAPWFILYVEVRALWFVFCTGMSVGQRKNRAPSKGAFLGKP